MERDHRTLKELGLVGVEQTIDARIAQAELQHQGYGEFLDRVLRDELDGRSQRTLRGRLLRVGAAPLALADVAELRRKLLPRTDRERREDAWAVDAEPSEGMRKGA